MKKSMKYTTKFIVTIGIMAFMLFIAFMIWVIKNTTV